MSEKTTIEIVAERLPSLEEAIKRADVEESRTIDGREQGRLARFVPADQLSRVGCELQEGADPTPDPWTAENVASQLANDVEFAFEKAIGGRGISAACMYEVLSMWCRVLAPEFEIPPYDNYGLDAIGAVAKLFNLPDRR